MNDQLQNLKSRLLTGWNFPRIIYTTLGLFAITKSIQPFEWTGVVFGGYLALMGIFSLGCISGSCGTSYLYQPKNNQKVTVKNINSQQYKQ